MLLDIEPIDNNLIDDVFQLQKKCYDRYEFLGDRVFDYAVSRYLYIRYPEQNSGYLTIAKQKIVQKKSLAKISRKIGLVKYAIIARNMELENARDTNDTLAEDIFEAFICAIFEEVTKDQFEELIFNIIEIETDIPSLMYNNDDYMSRLITLFHQLNMGNPRKVEEYSDNINKIFKYSIKTADGSKTLGCGTAKTKALAQQQAAKKAYLLLTKKPDTDTNIEDDYYGEIKKSKK